MHKFTNDKPGPQEIIETALRVYRPIAVYVGYSGGNDSLRVTHWTMANVPGAEVFHINTGIGCERTRVHVRQVCKDRGWPLHEIRAKEDCGQDYDALCREHGFPGPDGHNMMYARLKERCVRLLLRRAKDGHSRGAKVMLISGLQHDDSKRRMRYAGREINSVGSQLWTNPFYWSSKAERDAYIAEHALPINPVTRELGMSGECGCGAFAQPGELARWRAVDPSFGERIDRLSQEVLAAGFTWSWEGHPPAGGHNKGQSLLMPLCGDSCFKSAIVRGELADEQA
jgi:3'-phosphoadenosine 5'-phosphosulfate sulfotransferase (PAPS reductase)/FAD synthetase